MAKHYCWPPQCCICGHFVNLGDYDEGTHYGSYDDYEPPDPVVFCNKCAGVEYICLITNRFVLDPTRCWWLPPRYEWMAFYDHFLCQQIAV